MKVEKKKWQSAQTKEATVSAAHSWCRREGEEGARGGVTKEPKRVLR